MTEAFPEAMVTGYEHLEATVNCDTKDRHVLAAAVAAGADALVTVNLRDFPTDEMDRLEVDVLHPEQFLFRSGPWTSMQSVLPYSATRPDGSAHPRSAGRFRHRLPRLFGGGQRRHLLRSLRTRGSAVGSGVRFLHGVGRRLHDPRQDRGRHVAGLGPGEGNAQRQAGLPPRLEPFSAVGRAPHEWAIRDGGDRIWHADVPRAGSVLRRATELDPLLGRTNGPAPRVRHRRRRASAG